MGEPTDTPGPTEIAFDNADDVRMGYLAADALDMAMEEALAGRYEAATALALIGIGNALLRGPLVAGQPPE